MKHLETGTGPLVSDLVPLTHAGLRISRVFFPFEDAMGEEISWTTFVPADRGFSAGTTWRELLEDAGREPEHYRAANGVLDEKTAAGLRELIGDLRLTALYWPGYWNVWPGMQAQGIKPDYTARTPNNEVEEFISRSITAADIQAGLRVPEFAWDDDGTLAWGAQLYPDSLVVAVAPELLSRLYGTGYLTATGVRGDEVMPPSAGD